jgi:hypothetical protein
MREYTSISSLGVLSVLAGCAGYPPDLQAAGMVDVIARQSDDQPRLSITTVYDASRESVIRGKLSRPLMYGFETFNGHIDVTYALPRDGKFTVHDAATVRRARFGNENRYAHFVVRLGTKMKSGTVLTVAYSRGDYQNPT